MIQSVPQFLCTPSRTSVIQYVADGAHSVKCFLITSLKLFLKIGLCQQCMLMLHICASECVQAYAHKSSLCLRYKRQHCHDITSNNCHQTGIQMFGVTLMMFITASDYLCIKALILSLICNVTKGDPTQIKLLQASIFQMNFILIPFQDGCNNELLLPIACCFFFSPKYCCISYFMRI